MISCQRIMAVVLALLVGVAATVLGLGYSALHGAETALQNRDYRSATEAYARAARILFWRADLWEQAGFAALQAQEISTAIYYFEHGKLTERGQLALAYAYYQAGDTANAQAAFETGAELYHTPSFYEGLAVVYRSQKNWAGERSALEKQIHLDQGNARAHYRLGVLLTVLDPQIALPELMSAATLDHQFDPAVQTLRTALNLSATQPDASRQMVTVGRALGLVEDWELAMLAFEKAIELDGKNAEAWAWLGEAKQHVGQDGRVELDHALELKPATPLVHALRGLYWNRRKNFKQALAEYLLAVKYDAQNPAWWAALGGAYAKSGDLVSALAAYQRATELAPQESEYWRLLAIFCADNGIDVETTALPAAQKAVELAPDDPLALDALGYVYYAARRYANAEKILTDVTQRFPQEYQAQIHLALVYLAQGNGAAAFRELNYVRDADAQGEAGALAATLLQKYFPQK